MIFSLEGIPVTVEKKRIKHLYLRIQPDGSVHLSAPLGVSDAAIRAFAASRIGWVQQHLQQLEAAPSVPMYSDGDILPLWGRMYRLRVLPTMGKCGAGLESGVLTLHAGAGSSPSERGAALRTLYRQELLSAIPGIRRTCESIVGQCASEVRVRDMRTRWGTCSVSRRRIWLSLRLAEKPPECLRCVMIHELTHLLVPNHSPRFWALMDQFCPDWRHIHRILGGPHAK